MAASRVVKPHAGSTDVLVPIVEYDALRDRADRYEYALTLLHDNGGGSFLVLTHDEQQVVVDAIRAAANRRREPTS